MVSRVFIVLSGEFCGECGWDEVAVRPDGYQRADEIVRRWVCAYFRGLVPLAEAAKLRIAEVLVPESIAVGTA